MIVHENCLLADDSHEVSYLIFFLKTKRIVAKFVICCSRDWCFKGYYTKYDIEQKKILSVSLTICQAFTLKRVSLQP